MHTHTHAQTVKAQRFAKLKQTGFLLGRNIPSSLCHCCHRNWSKLAVLVALGLLAVSFGSLVTLYFFTPTHSCFCACLHFYSLKLVAPKIWKRRASHMLWLVDILIVMPASPVYLLLPCASLTKNQLPSSSTFSFICCSFFSPTDIISLKEIML